MDMTYLFTALVWSSIGLGFFLYGKKQQKFIPLIGGLCLMGMSYLIRTPLNLSLGSLAVIAAIYFTRNMG